jgi:PAS domain S-box-containing protein
VTGDGRIAVLCVDDEPGFADLTGNFLEEFEPRIDATASTDGREALAYLENEEVDCIVSDYDMPGVDGLALLETVRARSPTLPFVMFTGNGSEGLASDALSAGASDYVEKEPGKGCYELLARRIGYLVGRARARREAEASRDLADTVFELAPDPIVVAVDGEFVHANPAALDLWGVEEKSRLVGRDFGAFVGKGYTDAVAERLQAVGCGERTAEYVPRVLLTVDDEQVPVELTAGRATWDGEDGVVVVVRDLTDDSAATERERYRRAFEQAFDAMVMVDDRGHCLELNRRACALFGAERPELLGEHVGGPQATFEPAEPWASPDAVGVEDGRFRVAGGNEEGQGRGPATGEYVVLNDVVPGEHLLVFREASDAERQETRLREMYEVIADRSRSFEEQVTALLALGREELGTAYGSLSRIEDEEYVFEVVDADDDSIEAGDVVPLEATNCEITASTERTVVLGDVVRDAPGETDRAGYQDWGIACYVGAPVYVDEEVYGTVCFYDIEARSGQFSDWEVTLVDLMSRWVSSELQQRRATERLEARNDRLDRFASIVSHDLRNPISVLQGGLDLAEETGDPEDFERCRTAVERMESLVGNLLTLARSGGELGDRETVGLGDLAEACWHTVDTGDATLEVASPRTVFADPSRLRQLLENLVRNAVRHGGETVTVGALEDGTGFYVADDGSGIPGAEREAVFENGYSTAENGTGLGLSIVRTVAEAHGWTVAVVESESGGARFEFAGVDAG